MTIKKMRDFIKRVRWKTAKKGDHSYNVREWHEDDTEFVEFVEEVRKSGYAKYFWGHKYIYMEIGDHEYWTMGSPIEETIILNRAEVKEAEWPAEELAAEESYL